MPMRTNFRRFKEPRGFIKVLEFLIAILAFSTTAGYYSEYQVKVRTPCSNNGTLLGSHKELLKFGYPFDKIDYYIDQDDTCNNTVFSHVQHDLRHNYKSESEFFVFVGVVSFLYSVVAMVYYVVFEDPAKYGPGGSGREMKSFATVDVVITMVLALFWFAGSIAWAAGLTSLKDNTDPDNFIENAKECTVKNAVCTTLKTASYATLTISVLFGFLSCFLWCANIWFVYKETVWHKEPGATTSAEQPKQEIPHQQVPDEQTEP